MNYDYCNSCGGKIEYLMQKPNFCPSCGATMGSGASPKNRPTPPRAFVADGAAKIDDAEGTDIECLPDLHKLEYDIENDGSFGVIGRRTTLGEVMGLDAETPSSPTREPQKKRGRPRKNPSTPKKKESGIGEKFKVVQGTIEECKSSADNTIDVGEEG